MAECAPGTVLPKDNSAISTLQSGVRNDRCTAPLSLPNGATGEIGDGDFYWAANFFVIIKRVWPGGSHSIRPSSCQPWRR